MKRLNSLASRLPRDDKFNLEEIAKQNTFSTKYSYDELDRIVQVSSPAGTYNYTYNKKGQIASLSFGGTTIQNTYDKAGRLVSKTFSSPQSPDPKPQTLCSYEYDKLDRRVKASFNGVEWIYGYDKFNQLISAGSSDGKIYGYSFDPIGNRITSHKGTETQSYAYNKLNQIVSSEISDMKSDAASEKAGKDFIYDAYGNLLKSPGCEYRYDLHNRLVEIKKSNVRCEFSYDVFSRRTEKKVFENGKLAKHLKFAYDGFKCVGEIDAAGGEILRNYVWSGGELLGVCDVKSGKRYSYLTDGNKNVIKILDESGGVAAEYSYSPFSEQIGCSGSYAGDNPFRFSSEYFDPETGLVYYNFRYYSPALGRWTSRDPIEEKGGYNPYAMVHNDCLNKRDYLGTCLYFTEFLAHLLAEIFGEAFFDSELCKEDLIIIYIRYGKTGEKTVEYDFKNEKEDFNNTAYTTCYNEGERKQFNVWTNDPLDERDKNAPNTLYLLTFKEPGELSFSTGLFFMVASDVEGNPYYSPTENGVLSKQYYRRYTIEPIICECNDNGELKWNIDWMRYSAETKGQLVKEIYNTYEAN